MKYNIILDNMEFKSFVDGLPDLLPHEVWYICLFGRHKYDPAFPNTKDSGQLARVVARNKDEFEEKVGRFEVPIGAYSRDGVMATQECLAVYVTVNPCSLIKANKALLVELAERFAKGNIDFNPISVSTTCIHRSIDRKIYLDFDFDGVEPEAYLQRISEILPSRDMFRVLHTRGGFHLQVKLEKIRGLKNWYQELSGLPGCDVRGSNVLMPVPGCTQGGFTPYF